MRSERTRSVTRAARLPRLPVLLALPALLVATTLAPVSAADLSRALELYDAGRYAEARPLLEEVVAAGDASGEVLYRLFYCRLDAGDPRAREALEQAREALEAELPRGDVTTYFYLVNAYQNLGRQPEGQRTARSAVERLGKGELPEPATAAGMFQVAKLYADTNDAAHAAEWYERSLAALDAEGKDEESSPYVAWAVRFLADHASRVGDHDAAERYLTRQLARGSGSADDYDRLATARAQLGLYLEAAEAWRQAERLNPAEADRARYGRGVVTLAADAGTLPFASPDGRPWEELSKAELEQVLSEQGTLVRETIARAEEINAPIRAVMTERAELERQLEAPDTDKAERKRIKKRVKELQQDFAEKWTARGAEFEALQAKVDAAKPIFAAAALEHILKRYGLRETAFFGGYAPLIFHVRRWTLPDP